MIVIGSRATPKKERVYHKENCIYATRIKTDNKIRMTVERAENRHFCECKYCGGLQGDVRTHKKFIAKCQNKNKMNFSYQSKSDTLYIQTEIGFWKIYLLKDYNNYVLYHLNVFTKGMSFEEASRGIFHRQHDMKAAESITSLIQYVIAHDKAKVIIMKDYHDLPQHSKQQRKYYRQAERKVKHQEVKRLDSLFMMIENQNPKIKEAQYY